MARPHKQIDQKQFESLCGLGTGGNVFDNLCGDTITDEQIAQAIYRTFCGRGPVR